MDAGKEVKWQLIEISFPGTCQDSSGGKSDVLETLQNNTISSQLRLSHSLVSTYILVVFSSVYCVYGSCHRAWPLGIDKMFSTYSVKVKYKTTRHPVCYRLCRSLMHTAGKAQYSLAHPMI